jgi:two-component system nitrogen regulation sensor histidine kinase NtrY
MLKIDKKTFVNHDYHEMLAPEHQQILDDFINALEETGRSSIERPLRLTVGNETFSLRVYVSRLTDEDGGQLGHVLVFDNLTELEKAQRMAAWREVARRIAHEVKNPLTPIQLSAQRLRKRFLEKLAGESNGDVFDLCTKTIINQVEELKRLVGEFSSFARMPAVQKAVNSLPDVVREVMVLYQEGHKNIKFAFKCEQDIPRFSFDFKQMRRVLINLLDNAVAAVADSGNIEVRLDLDSEQKLVYLEVSDDGPGVKDEDKLHLFEPYFSTKKSGTGLGLAIVGTIIADHNGYIRIKDNKPQGARFIVELPLG